MTFAFTVEDGTVVTGANSYVAVATADDYYVIDPNFSATWAAYTTQQKQYFLAWSTRILDQKTEWVGRKTTDTSSLRWPRFLVYDADGLLIDQNTIPRQLIQATLEILKYIVTNDPTTTQDITHYARLKVDVVEVAYQPNTWQAVTPPIINQILAPLGRFRVGGSGFGRIVKG